MKRIFISSVQKEFERERAAIKKMIESDPILSPNFKVFVFEIDAPAADKSTQQVYLKEIEKSDIYLLLVGNKYGYIKEGEVSPTEQEFDKAQELGLTKLVFVRGTDNSKRDAWEALFWDKVSRERVEVISPGRLHRAISVADLYMKHESHAVNPRIARAMYQVKYIETMGTGLTDLLDACKANGLKRPLLEEVPSGFRIVIWRPKAVANRGGNAQKGSLKSTQKTPQKTLQKTPQKILAAIRANPSVGTQEMADMIGVERSTVARAIAKLKRDGILRRVGPDKGGHWEVVER